MKRLKESALLKFFAGLFLGIGIIVGIISGILAVVAYSEDYYKQGGKQRVRDSIMESIIWHYDNEAIQYFQEVVNEENNSDYEWAYDYYPDYFSEENTNYMFRVISDEADSQGEVLLSNYSSDDVQYENETKHNVLVRKGYEDFTFELDIDDMVKAVSPEDIPDSAKEYYSGEQWWFYSVPNQGESYNGDLVAYIDDSNPDSTEASINMPATTEMRTDVSATTEAAGQQETTVVDTAIESETTVQAEVYEEEAGTDYNYGGEVIYAYSYPLNLNNVTVYEAGDGIHVVIDDSIDYSIMDNPKLVKELSKFTDSMMKYDYIENVSRDYDYIEGVYTVTYEYGDYLDVILESSVKSELTANDRFADSLRLKYMVQLFDAATPAFIISCIVVLITFIYLIFAVGHRKNIEGVVLSKFDRIPYDIIAVIYLAWIVSGWALLDEVFNSYSDWTYSVIGSIPIIGAVMLFPLFLATTAVRIKAGNLFGNTITAKVCKWCVSIIKKCFKKLVSVLRYMRENLNLYLKWLVGFGALAIFELLLCGAWSDTGFIFAVFLLDIIIVGFVLIFAIINMNKLKEGAKKIASGNVNYKIDTEHMLWEFKHHGETLNSINDGIQVAVNERMKSEHMQTELITNVTHDIKTPLTSIISYVDLLSKEELQNEKAKEYIEVLARQAERLKKLIEDLIEASKATTGNLQVNFDEVDVKVLLEQSLGEFGDKLSARGLKTIVNFHTDDTVVRADGKHLWRVFDNLINNISKYAQDNTRVYIDVERITNDETIDGMTLDEIVKNNYTGNNQMKLKVSFKNISKDELNISGDELMERFVRGDKSRNTEGNGLGLSIAKSLMKIQNGDLQIMVDGDLFKVELILM